MLAVVVSMGVPAAAHAGKKTVAAILNSDLPRYIDEYRAFLRELAQHGYDPSKIDVISQTPNPDPISWSNSIRKVSALGADVVVTFGAPVTLTALRQSMDIPIVFADVYGPVETGISRSATQGNKDVCGISSKLPMVTLIKTAHDIKKFKTMGVIFNAHEVGSVVQMKEMKRLGAQMGFSVTDVNVTSPIHLESALKGVLQHVDVLFVSEGTIACQRFDWIVEKSLALKIPVISQMPESAERGGLLSLEIDTVEQGQEAGVQVAKILNGKRPEKSLLKMPKKVHFVLNLRTARELGLAVPFQVLSAITRVIK